MGPFHISCYVKDAVCINLPKEEERRKENLRSLSVKRKKCLGEVCKNVVKT